MPSALSASDKETINRTIPSSTNKIHAAAIARLYVAYPDRQRWVYTGLQGAVVLTNDLVGNTFWIKMVDVSVSALLRPRYLYRLGIDLFTRIRNVVSYGIRRSMIPFFITRIEPSSIRLSSKTA
jgi:hypothetical protein